MLAPESMSNERVFDQPARHVLQRAFLGDDTVRRLLGHVQSAAAAFAPATVGMDSARRVDRSIRSALSVSDLGDFAPVLREKMLEVGRTVVGALGLQPFEPDQIETQLVAHGDGAFYGRHIDVGSRDAVRSQRVLTLVYYFYEVPKKFSGGQLRLYGFTPGSTRYSEIDPECDMLVAFPAFAHHEVRPVSCPDGRFMSSRFSITGWISRST